MWNMRIVVLLVSVFCFNNTLAQQRKLPVDTLVVTNHKTTIKGTTVNHRAETGTQPVWNDKGQPLPLYLHLLQAHECQQRKRTSIDFFIQWGAGFRFCVDACRLYRTTGFKN